MNVPVDRIIVLGDLKIPIHITAIDELTNSVVTLNARDYPNMPISDAVLASCAVQPYINRIEYEDKEKKIHKLFCCSPVHTLPLDVAEAEFVKGKYTFILAKHVLGYGFAGQINEIAKKTSKDSKNAYLETLNTIRPKSIIPQNYGSSIRLY
jgi:predicted acylesterase/phospholipase RssA